MNLCLNRFAMHKVPQVVKIDMRNAEWRKHLPIEMTETISRLASDEAHHEKLYVIVRDPTPGQAFGHMHHSVRIFAQSVLRALRQYCGRINRGYNAANYQFRERHMD